MPIDAIFAAGLRNELAADLTGGRIDKVQQPARDLLILSLRAGGKNRRLLISAGTGTARAHFTQESYENPQSPPMFCMLLRKHLTGARVAELIQPPSERVLIFRLDALDEMGTPVKKELVLEMMGRNSNVILIDGEGRIIDSLRRVDGDMSRDRQVLPGLFYRLPAPQDKPDILAASPELAGGLLASAGDSLSDKWLLGSFSGVSPLICRELSFRACGETSKPLSLFTQEERERLLKELSALRERAETGDFQPSMVLTEGKPTEFSFMPIFQYQGAGELKSCSGFSQLLDDYYSRRERQELARRRSQELMKSVKSAHDRAVRKLSTRLEELERTKNRDERRKMGDLVTSNLYRIKKGDRLLRCEDYYQEDSPLIEIPLDPLKTPQQNAAAYYREYNKAKTAAQYLDGLISRGRQEEEYLASVLDAVSRAESEQDLAEIRRELTEAGFIRRQKQGRREKVKESSPLRFISSEGTEILVGRNNTQNDLLTFKTARRGDMWLHVQRIHGSHVVIRCGDDGPGEATLREAASLAVLYSQAGEGGARSPVDYTQVRNVKKTSGALPGAVIYTEYKTILAEPDRALRDRLMA